MQPQKTERNEKTEKTEKKTSPVFITHVIFTALLAVIFVCVWALVFYYLDIFRRYHSQDSKSDLRVWTAMAVGVTTGTFIYIGATLRFYYEGEK